MKKLISVLLILSVLFSMMCTGASASGRILLNADFSSMDMTQFTEQFMPGRFEVDNDLGVLYGYYDAKALQSMYNNPDTVFDNTLNTWLTYDTTVRISFADDDQSDSSRYVCLAYCNDNRLAKGLVEEREFITFSYDIENQKFDLTLGGGPQYDSEGILMDSVEVELDSEGEEFYTLGMSVDKNRIRFFLDNDLIYDFQNTDMLIADSINSPFMFWNDGNFVQISNIVVATQGHLFPYADEPIVSDTQGVGTSAEPFVSGGDDPVDSTNEGSVPGNDVSGNPDPSVPSAGGEGGNGGNSGNNGGNGGNGGNNGGAAAATTTSQKIVEVTDAEGNTVTDAEGNAVTSISIVTNPNVPAATNANRPAGGNSTDTGDSAFVVVAVMVACLGTAIVVKKINVK